MLTTRNVINPHMRRLMLYAGFSNQALFCSSSHALQKPLVNLQPKTRRNPVNIQMLPDVLYEQLFRYSGEEVLQCEESILGAIKDHFKNHDLLSKITEKPSSKLDDVNLELPRMQGGNIDEHFARIAEEQAAPYKQQADWLASKDLPALPHKWAYSAGWTKYNKDGTSQAVDYPDSDAVVFDVEVLVQEGNYPTMATAASPAAWYSWCSDRLVKDTLRWKNNITTVDLIPLESRIQNEQTMQDPEVPRLVIGHNVGFDRSFIKEQYYIKGSRMRFLDTMSMHMMICGLTSFQRVLLVAKTKGSHRKEVREHERMFYGSQPNFSWIESSSLNNLNDVYQLHCKAEPLPKELREVFFKGTMEQVRSDFQRLMTYCATDVLATQQVFQKLWPQFLERFPHPVSLAGSLEMSTSYLPINNNWARYIQSANDTYAELQRELLLLLIRLANKACHLMHNKQYLNDPWLWNLDWHTKAYKAKKVPVKKKKKTKEKESKVEEESAAERVKKVMDNAEKTMYKVPAHMSGYPVWYSELCPLPSENLPSGPSKITIQRRIVPKLLRLTWDGFPLHFDDALGWGYLVPGRELTEEDLLDIQLARDEGRPVFPLEQALSVCKPRLVQVMSGYKMTEEDMTDYYLSLDRLGFTDDESKRIWQSMRMTRDAPRAKGTKKKDRRSIAKAAVDEGPHWHTGDGPYKEVNIPGCWFYKLPHKDGIGNRVGNPLAKDFVKSMEDGILSSAAEGDLRDVYKLGKLCSYWKNNQDRISSQMVVALDKQELPSAVTEHADYKQSDKYGAILPRLVTAGTVTRRAVEPTWMTASNPYDDRLGSELKAMVQTPPGYHLVGADVDSQELWIAALLGDAGFTRIHGSTVLSWATLQGTKSEGTDMHSMTAKIMGISRDHAKVFNYARIYGAGQRFAKQLLQRFNHNMPQSEVNLKVKALFTKTKGQKKTVLIPHPNEPGEYLEVKRWHGGSESHMFNMLEEIAKCPEPRTPVLGCQISEALMPEKVDEDFMPSRINWVIQSSAVDYLHLMLVSMRWLLDTYKIDGRFSISIHDEVRYLVSSQDRYRAALALQITNLLTRCMFAYKLNMPDLPLSVAFFSAVDIDKCMRKETTFDCVTPSNPRGLLKAYSIPKGEALTVQQLLGNVYDLKHSLQF